MELIIYLHSHYSITVQLFISSIAGYTRGNNMVMTKKNYAQMNQALQKITHIICIFRYE